MSSLTREDIQNARSACERLEADLSAFVDGELSSLDAQRVSAHVNDCRGCRAFIDTLASLSQMNRQEAAQEVLEVFGTEDLWGGLLQRLLAETAERLANVFYEVGRAFIKAGTDTSPHLLDVPVYRKRPGSIASLSRKGQKLAREYGDLAGRIPDRRRSGSRDLNRKGLFVDPDTRARGSQAFELGRRCLEQCLRLDPRCHNARIFLAHYFKVSGRLDRARQQLRIVLRSDAPAEARLLASHQLARVYSYSKQFGRAIELERGVLEEATRARDEGLQIIALTNLAIYSVKVDRLQLAEESIHRLVRDFPNRLGDTATAFRKARDFRRALHRHGEFLNGLRQRYPALFTT